MNDHKKRKIQKQIADVKTWAKLEKDLIWEQEREMLAKVREKCEHEFEWEHRMRESVAGFYQEYTGTCSVCGLQIHQENKPDGIDNIPETSDSFFTY